MTASDVNVVIDNIASKLGLAASNMSDFVPELARYHIAQDAANVVVCMIVLFVLALAVRWFIKQNISDIFDDFAVASIGICGGIAGAIICSCACGRCIRFSRMACISGCSSGQIRAVRHGRITTALRCCDGRQQLPEKQPPK